MRIVYKKRFEKAFKVLPESIKRKFYERLEIFIKDKFDSVLKNHPVDRAFPDSRSINVTGDYRAIFKEEKNMVVFITIGTHSELY